MILLYIFAVALLASWLVMYINGTRLRFFHDGKILCAIGATWPRWKLFRIAVVKLQVDAPSSGRRVLLYTRTYLRYIDIVADRRNNRKVANEGA